MPTPGLTNSLPTAPFPLCAAHCALLAEVNHRTANQFTLLTSYIHLSLEEFRRNPGEIRDLGGVCA